MMSRERKKVRKKGGMKFLTRYRFKILWKEGCQKLLGFNFTMEDWLKIA